MPCPRRVVNVPPLWPLPDDPVVAEVQSAAKRLDLGRRYFELDRRPEFPWTEFKALGEAGLLGLSIPSQLGGRGLPLPRAAVGLFHLAYLGGTAFAKISLQPEFAWVLAEHGSPEMLEKWFRPLLRGECLVGNQITEPGAGSDAGALSLEARRDGDGYLLTGTKSEVAMAPDAGAAIVYGRLTSPIAGDGITAFLVDQSLPGVTRQAGPGDLGEHWQRRGQVVYDHVAVPSSARVGGEGEGFRYARGELARERGLLAAIYLGVARASWDEAVAYVGERVAFRRPLSDQQAVAFPLVDDGAAIDSAWLFTVRALERLAASERPGDAVAETSLAKAIASDVALRAIDHAIQFAGGRGYSAAMRHEQRWRDVRSGPIAHGPSEVLRGVAARRLWPRKSPGNP
jgi:butyryl-CoA dehydrogenase